MLVVVERLVDRFAPLSARNRKGYNEPATRQEFILPLFRALGWNIEDIWEVSPGERVSRGYVDFAFRYGLTEKEIGVVEGRLNHE